MLFTKEVYMIKKMRQKYRKAKKKKSGTGADGVARL